MLPKQANVSAHSILGSVADFYQHKAFEEELENDNDIILTLPPILQTKQYQNQDDNKTHESNTPRNKPMSSIQNVLNSPTIASLFSPQSKQNRNKSKLKDIRKGQLIEKHKETKKLQQLLKGDRIYATREERVLKRWENQQKEWNLLKKNIALKVGKKEDDLVITRCEEWREMIEEIDLMTKSIPVKSMGSNHWQHSLRKKSDMDDNTQLIPIGNMFSGLYCKVTTNNKKPIKETVRKPRKLSIDSNNNNIFNNYNLPGKGAASKHWRERSVTFKYRKKLHQKMEKLKPNNLNQLDGLAIIGQNMFNIKQINYPLYSYERLTKQNSKIDVNGTNNNNKALIKKKSNNINDDTSYEFVEHEDAIIHGPSLDFTPSNIILFNTSLHKEQTKVLKIVNNGTTSMLLQFENAKQKFRNNAIFLYPTEQMSILPSETKNIGFYFKPSQPGSYHLVINIKSYPSIPQKQIQLQAICLIKDEDKIHRNILITAIKDQQIQHDAMEIVYNLINNVPDEDPSMNDLPKSFCQTNRDHKLYWYPQIFDKLQCLSKSIINKFRRRKRKIYKWDLSVSTLKDWLIELEEIHSASIIEPLRNELLNYIKSAQQIPPPNALYYDLCSTLITDLALQIPRFSWKSQQIAKTSYKKEQNEKELNQQQEQQIDDTEDDQSTINESKNEIKWNVFESELYQNNLYNQCNQYFYHIIDQFENSVIDQNTIDETRINLIKNKLQTKPQRILTFGDWINTNLVQNTKTIDENTENVDNNIDENDANIKCTEIKCLYNNCIQSIHSNSNITLLTSAYKSWKCSSKQCLIQTNEHKDKSDNDDIDTDEDDKDDEKLKESFQLDDFDLLPIFAGFNISQIFICKDMINILTDTGDVYCSVVYNLEDYQIEVLLNKKITKITGCSSTNRCVALSESGKLYEWNLIKEITENENKNTEKDENNDKNIESNDNDTEQIKSDIFKISEVKEWTEIDQEMKDVAISSTAYAAITLNDNLIIWGDYNEIYSIINEQEENKKNKSKNKNKNKTKDENQNNDLSKAYSIIEINLKTNENDNDNKDNINEIECGIKFQSIVACLNCFIVLDDTGKLYSFGQNECGTLGLGDIDKSLQPKLINFSDESTVIKSISTSSYGVISIDDKSNVYYWGKHYGVTPANKDNNEDDNHDNNEDDQTTQNISFNKPTQINIDKQFNPITKAIATDFGGFLWC